MSQMKLESLIKRWNNLHEEFPEKNFPEKMSLLLRLRRAISWLDRAEEEKRTTKKLDACFVFFWIAFNALYGRVSDSRPKDETRISEQKAFEKYFDDLAKLGDTAQNLICKIVENSIHREIERLLDNRFVFPDFWNYHHYGDQKTWERQLKRKLRQFHSDKSRKDIRKILSAVFSRLYALRNQLIHGSAAKDSELNHSQLRDGTKIIARLLPVFIDLMLENHDKDWGKPSYPRVGGKPLLPLQSAETSK